MRILRFVPAPLAVALLSLVPAAASAQDVIVAPERSSLALEPILATLIYGLIGILLCISSYFAFDKIAGLSLKHELVEDQNVAVGIMLAGVFIGIAIVVAAVMLS